MMMDMVIREKQQKQECARKERLFLMPGWIKPWKNPDYFA